MSNYPLTLSATPSYNGINAGDGNIRVPQGTTTEEFKEYLKEYEPDTFQALEKIDAKYPPRELTPEEREKIKNTKLCLGNPAKIIQKVKPSTIKNWWSKIEGWFSKMLGKNHLDANDYCEIIDRGSQIWDLSQATPQSYTPIKLPNLNS